jgi:hypothetical protein
MPSIIGSESSRQSAGAVHSAAIKVKAVVDGNAISGFVMPDTWKSARRADYKYKPQKPNATVRFGISRSNKMGETRSSLLELIGILLKY